MLDLIFPGLYFTAGLLKTFFEGDITESQMVLSSEHNNAAIKLTLCLGEESSVWVQF